MLSAILTTAATTAPSQAWNCMEEAAGSSVCGSVWNHRGQKHPAPVCSHLLSLEPDLLRLLQAALIHWAEGPQACSCSPSLPAGIAFPCESNNRAVQFCEPSCRGSSFYLEELNSLRCLRGLCEEEEEHVTGKEHPSCRGTSAPSVDKVSQSAELGFQAALSCTSTRYNSLIFLNAK